MGGGVAGIWLKKSFSFKGWGRGMQEEEGCRYWGDYYDVRGLMGKLGRWILDGGKGAG